MKHGQKRIMAGAVAAVMTLSALPAAGAARLNELQYAPDKGVTDTVNYVNQLDSLKRVLFVGAHPDDETNSLLVYLNRKEGADTIYTSINWGEGGDNAIGNELYGALGVLRSQELNSARMFDQAEQMYGGAVDFGYSVSLKESLLGDPETGVDGIYSIDVLGYNLAQIIRTTRPQVIFSNHKAPNTDHGQHRAVGWLIEYAMDLAADESYTVYDEAGKPLPAWQVQKFFATTPSDRVVDSYAGEFTAVGEKSRKDPTVSDLVLDLGAYDPVLGMSYDEWGILGRNMHKCQKMIGTPEKGVSERGYILKKAAPGVDVTKDDFSTTVFGGLEVTELDDWNPIGTGSMDDREKMAVSAASGKSFAEPVKGDAVEILVSNVEQFQQAFTQQDVTANAELLTGALKALDQIERQIDPANADDLEYARRVRTHIGKVLQEIYAVDVDVAVDDTDVHPGQTVTVTATVWARGDADGEVILPDTVSDLLVLPEGWKIVSEKHPKTVRSNGRAAGKQFVCEVKVPENDREYTGPFNAPYDEPYTNQAYPHGGVRDGVTPNTPKAADVEAHQDPAKMTAAMAENQNAYEDLVFGITTDPTDPYSHAPIRAEAELKAGGASFTVESEPEMRVVPKVSLLVENESSMLKYVGEDIHSTIHVTLRSNLKGATGDIRVTAVPEDTSSGIQVSTETVSMSAEDQTVTVTLDVTIPKTYKDKSTALVVTATLPDGETFSEGYQVIDYDHINTQNYYKKAVQNVTVAEYQLPTDDIKIGFLKGGSDDFVFDYIKGMYASPEKAAANLRELSTADIAKSGAELAQQFDTIIIGKTALANQSPVSGALRSSMQNLLDYANAGGNLVLHYQNWTQADGKMPLAPVPFELGTSNINKEDCEVYVNDAAAATPFYTGVNKIDLAREGEVSRASVWDGWTQQRCEWTPGSAAAGQVEVMEALGYTVLFEGQDPEGEMRPAILYQEMENGGHYTYSAVVWDRQLRALNPGAYKLYANLISMGTEGAGNVTAK